MSTIVEHVACTFCGCVCDDIVVEFEESGTIKPRRACIVGRGVLTHHDPVTRKPTVGGREVSWQEAVGEAAAILEQADSPLIYGLSSTAIEAQRKAVELADRVGAVIDTTSSVCHGPTGLAMQAVGEATCTLGEVRDRADLVVFWGCNPATSHPRHFARFSLTPKGTLTPNGRQDRTVFVVDVRPTRSSKVADCFLQVDVGADFEVLTVLRSLVKGKDVEADSVGGVPLSQLRELADRMKGCRYGVVFMGMGLTMSRGRHLNVSELFSLVAEVNEHSRFSVIPMRGHGNVAGADQVLTWQSGYPFAVSFARGYPQFGPGEFSAVDMLARREADAVLVVASDPAAHFPRAAAEHLERIPVIVLDPAYSLTASVARVVFSTAYYGVDAPGTVYRMDNVPIPLQGVVASERSTDEHVLSQIIEAVK